ncbi:hypothetical protein GYMLUDRAFT_252684 [Collybiopsis luxurians FD-317 M1]|uniref:DUF4219 domain-containing protein n=1 Tax=Collybiopsis luxurians FD-317 M1 TaxID=944289 RepID=A0A0D0AKJ4_9AGAR|nr:hypothetical protein GYMLUDRAFT_252684 [Collybiopsis luxurians FD-317 M1]
MAESSLPKIKVLDNSNYNEWCRDMQAWLMSRGYWRLVIGKEATLEKIHVSKQSGARFNAYDELFSIVKSKEESLQSLGDRVGAAMNQIKRLHPKNFIIELLDKELEAMALIRSLPGEYSHLQICYYKTIWIKTLFLDCLEQRSLTRRKGNSL